MDSDDTDSTVSELEVHIECSVYKYKDHNYTCKNGTFDVYDYHNIHTTILEPGDAGLVERV